MAQIKRHAAAKWQGSGKDGSGTLTTQSATLKDTPYGFNSRFGDGKGTNPEELIAAAHAGCFAMALSAMLTEAGHPPSFIESRADVELSMDGGPHIASIRLSVRGEAPGVSQDEFRDHAEKAKANCPISKALASVPITLEVKG